MISFHVEATYHPYRVIDMIKGEGKMAGVALNPGTSVSSVMPILEVVDFVLVMTVSPGFGGQEFIRNMLSKISELNIIRAERKLQFLIEVDGGINDQNASEVVREGADILVLGSFIFSGNRKEKMESVKNSIRGKNRHV